MQVIEGGFQQVEGMRFAIVAGRFNALISDRLVEGAVDALRRHGVLEADITIAKAPGSFEIPLVARRLAQTKRFDAIICVGAVIRGATPHFDQIASAVSSGISRVIMETDLPISFGILTTDTIEQAIERAGTKMGNKGWEAALVAIEMANLLKIISS